MTPVARRHQIDALFCPVGFPVFHHFISDSITRKHFSIIQHTWQTNGEAYFNVFDQEPSYRVAIAVESLKLKVVL